MVSVDNLEWIMGYRMFEAFAEWARRHNFYIEEIKRIEQSFADLRPLKGVYGKSPSLTCLLGRGTIMVIRL